MTDILARYKAHQQHSSNDGPSVHECITEIERLRRVIEQAIDWIEPETAGTMTPREIAIELASELKD